MKLAVLSESAADEAAIQILIGGIRAEQIETAVPSFPLRTRGWPSVVQILPSVIKHLHYRTDAEAFAVVVDSNHSPVHQPTHDLELRAAERCRLCQLRGIVRGVQGNLTPVTSRSPMKIAVGVAVPAIEAWYRVGRDPNINEAALIERLNMGSSFDLKRDLKRDVYGTDRPSLEIETARARAEAERLIMNLGALEAASPNGFGILAQSVRSW